MQKIMPCFLFFVLLCCVPPIANTIGQCDFVINELNSDDPGNKDFYEFVELFATHCPSGKVPSLQPYVVLIIEEYSSHHHQHGGHRHQSASHHPGPKIKFSADLYHKTLQSSEKRYFVIGSPNNDLKPDMTFLDSAVGYHDRKKNIQKSMTDYFKRKDVPASTEDVIPNGAHSPLALVLLKVNRAGLTAAERDVLQAMKLSYYDNNHRLQKRQTVRITDAMTVFIKTYLHDMLVYSKRAIFNRCTYFEQLVEDLASAEDYEVRPGREWDTIYRQDLSINRCPELHESRKPLLFTRFKLGKPTSGTANDCSGPHYILEDRLQDIVSHDRVATPAPPEIEVPAACSSSTDPVAFAQLRSRAVTADIEEQMELSQPPSDGSESDSETCPANANVDVSNESVIKQLEAIHSMLEQLVQQQQTGESRTQDEEPEQKRQRTIEIQTIDKPWTDTSHFQQHWLDQIKKHQSKYLSTTSISAQMKTWLQFHYNADEPSASTYSCRFCTERVASRHFDARYIPDLAKPGGFFSSEGRALYLKLYKHSQLRFHQETVQEMKDSYKSNLEASIAQYKQEEQQKLTVQHTATAMMIRTVYAEVRVNIPFETHKILVKLQKLNGLQLGVHHYERRSATRMVESISNTMHQALLTYLQSETHPISLIVDTSTDNSLNNYLIVYLETIENGHPHVYFYKLIQLVASETAEIMFNELQKTFTEDGIWNTIKSNLVGWGSDGAAVMLGRHNGLAKRVNDQVEKNIFQVHCMGHRLQLAAGHCFDEIPDLRFFEKTVKAIYTFYTGYYNTAVKKKGSLKLTAAAFGKKFFELTYIFDARWVASELSSLQAIKKDYKILLLNLEDMQVDTGFDQDTRQTARGHKERFTDIRWYSLLLFLIDTLKVLATSSKNFQKDPQAGGVVIGMEKYRTQLLDSIRSFRNGDGSELQYFLLHSKCNKNAPRWIRCTTADLDNSDFMMDNDDDGATQATILEQRQRRNNYHQLKPLSELRQLFVDTMVEKLEEYFPEGSFQIFDALDPLNFPEEAGQVPIYVPRIMPIAERFEENSLVVADEFSDFLIDAIQNDFDQFCAYKVLPNPAHFWNTYLQDQTNVVLGPTLKSLIETVLCLPVGAAEAERGFSIMNHIKYDRRSRLTPQHLEDSLRIRINGPPLEKFDATRYTKEWLKSHQETGDPTGVRDTSKAETELKSVLF